MTIAWSGIIRNHRKSQCLKQTALAEMIGVHQSAVSRWERGQDIPDVAAQRRLRDIIFRASRHPNIRALQALTARASGMKALVAHDDIRVLEGAPAFTRAYGDQHLVTPYTDIVTIEGSRKVTDWFRTILSDPGIYSVSFRTDTDSWDGAVFHAECTATRFQFDSLPVIAIGVTHMEADEFICRGGYAEAFVTLDEMLD